VAQEQDETLHEGDFEKQEPDAQSAEVGEGGELRPPGDRRQEAQRRQDEGQGRDQGQRQEEYQHQVTAAAEGLPGLAEGLEDGRHLAPAEEVEEEGAVIGRRPDVVRVVGDESLGVGPQELLKGQVVTRLLEDVVTVGLLGGHARQVDQVEVAGGAKGPDGGQFRLGEGPPPDQQRHGLETPIGGQLLVRTLHPQTA